MEVYVLYSAELDFRQCLIGVYDSYEAAEKAEAYYSKLWDIGSMRIESFIVENEGDIDNYD